MRTVEVILNGDNEEERQNADCYLHYASCGDDIPEYILQHEDRIDEARIQYLDDVYQP